MHDCPKLKEMALAYVTKVDSDSSFKTMMKTDEWKKWSLKNGVISDEIVDAVFEKINYYKEIPSNVPSTSSSN